MRRQTMIVAILLMISLPMMADHVTPETAQKAAKTFLNNNGAKASQLTDISKAAGFPNLYVFNADEGFVVMAADDCVQPVLGYSLTGKFVAEDMPSNVRGWLQDYNDEIQYAIENQLKATSETIQLWNNLVAGKPDVAKATVIVDALVKTQWNQRNGYNDLCPYDSNAGELTVAGCVATAMAQIMRYWEYPSHGVGSHSYTPNTHPEYGIQSVNFASATYDWVGMPLLSSSAEVAKLMYHCGVSVDMDYDIYSNGGSLAYSDIIPAALTNYFNYKSTASFKYKSSYSNANWISLLKTELNAARPVQYNGRGSVGGHAFLCDGYDSRNYFHFNWGWSGHNDGFYSLSSLNPESGYNFTNNQSGVFGIEPKACTTSTPNNFSVTTEGSTAILTWDAVANAASYSIYKNGFLIANINGTTYSDCDLEYGTYDYYIKSIDSNGSSSSPTATITAAIEPIPSGLTVTKNGNQAILNWTEPSWYTPQNDNEVLTYGNGTFAYKFGLGGGTNAYFGHRYPLSDIGNNKILYKVSFYIAETGLYTLIIYSSTPGNNRPQTQIHTQSITTSSTGWNDILIDDPILLDDTKDLWVFIYDPEGKNYPMGIGQYNGNNGNYYSYSPYNPTSYLSTISGYAMLIRTYIANGPFTYNLYDNTTLVAQNLSGTSYSVSNIASNTVHKFTLKTNFNDGETYASNMAGLAIGNASLSSLNLGSNDRMTITEGSRLTVSGTLSDVNTDNLILEDAAQLINNSTGVKATVLKNSIPTSIVNDNWQLISSPFSNNITPTVENGILNGAFDLYYYDEPTCYWMNYKIKPFNIERGNGYLYANGVAGGTTLQLTGTLQPSGSSFTVSNMNYSSEHLTGFNLVGNPFPCNAIINKDFYVMNNHGDGIVLAESGRNIAPCESVFVQLSNEFDAVIFSRASSRSEATAKSFDLVLSQGQSHIDRVRVRFGEGKGMEKIRLNENKGFLCIAQDETYYAVAFVGDQGTLYLHFHANANSPYRITVETETIQFTYLHLIDQLTGKDIDLLADPTYTFEANPQDHPDRFKLLYSIVE